MTATQRLLKFVDSQGISKSEFYRKINVTNGLFSKTENISSENLEKIASAYPLLNILWVINGTGDMCVDLEKNPHELESIGSQSPEDTQTMKENMNSIERLSQFVDYLDISKRKFYENVGLSNGFLDKQKNISTDTLAKIHDKYPQLNILWVIYGTGEMLKDSEDKNYNPPQVQESVMSQFVEEMRTLKENLLARLDFLEKELNIRDEEIAYFKVALRTEQQAHAETRLMLGK